MKSFYIIFITALLSPLFYVPAVNAQTTTKIQNGSETERNDLVFSKVETEASFPGGQGAWMKYITEQIQKSQFKKKDYGTCIVKFVVDKNGNISDVAATTMIGSQLAKVSIEAIKNGPKWKPATKWQIRKRLEIAANNTSSACKDTISQAIELYKTKGYQKKYCFQKL